MNELLLKTSGADVLSSRTPPPPPPPPTPLYYVLGLRDGPWGKLWVGGGEFSSSMIFG